MNELPKMKQEDSELLLRLAAMIIAIHLRESTGVVLQTLSSAGLLSESLSKKLTP